MEILGGGRRKLCTRSAHPRSNDDARGALWADRGASIQKGAGACAGARLGREARGVRLLPAPHDNSDKAPVKDAHDPSKVRFQKIPDLEDGKIDVGKALVGAINGPQPGSASTNFGTGAELCFDTGVGNVWTHAIVPDHQGRAALIATLEKVGVKDLNGRPFSEAIVAQTWQKVRDRLVSQGLGDWSSAP